MEAIAQPRRKERRAKYCRNCLVGGACPKHTPEQAMEMRREHDRRCKTAARYHRHTPEPVAPEELLLPAKPQARQDVRKKSPATGRRSSRPTVVKVGRR